MGVLGVDACGDGWVGVGLAGGEIAGVVCEPSIDTLVTTARDMGGGGEVEVVGIDIPIGLASSATREADVLARARVGPRRSSVFLTPLRDALEAPTYEAANRLQRERTGAGVSRQAYGLRTKILEVDRWTPPRGTRAVEIHPEVSFAVLHGGPLPDAKRTWAGAELRRRLLADAGIVLDGDLGLSGRRVAVDDVLDAAVVAWSAERVRSGHHLTIPDPPQPLDDGTTAAIHA